MGLQLSYKFLLNLIELIKWLGGYIGYQESLIKLINPQYKKPNPIRLITIQKTNPLPSLFFLSLLEDTILDEAREVFWGL